jgi:MoaE-MoaD fusion protein
MILVRTFARYRELLGFETLELALPAPPTLGTLLALPVFSSLPREALLAVDQAFSDRDAPLRDGAEVALMPPVSGG